jgi:hypothetical protein
MSPPFPGRFEPGFDLLSISLSASVPLRILEIIRAGGPTEADYERIASYTDDLLANGADLFFRSAGKGATAERFNQVTDALAVLSFQPGGIDVLGMHFNGSEMRAWFEATPPPEEEEQDAGH